MMSNVAIFTGFIYMGKIHLHIWEKQWFKTFGKGPQYRTPKKQIDGSVMFLVTLAIAYWQVQVYINFLCKFLYMHLDHFMSNL